MKLARFFAALVRAEFSAETLSRIVELNQTPRYRGCCATHDFCDANSLMYGAFCALHFREPDPACEDDVKNMNLAWDVARESGFTV